MRGRSSLDLPRWWRGWANFTPSAVRKFTCCRSDSSSRFTRSLYSCITKSNLKLKDLFSFYSLCITVMRIRIRLITLMRIEMQIWIMIFIWCGSDFSPWCGPGSGSRSKLLNKGSTPWKSAKIGSYSIHYGFSLANLGGSGSVFGSSLSLWCGSGSGFLFDVDGDPVWGSKLPKWCEFMRIRIYNTGFNIILSRPYMQMIRIAINTLFA